LSVAVHQPEPSAELVLEAEHAFGRRLVDLLRGLDRRVVEDEADRGRFVGDLLVLFGEGVEEGFFA
jgi:hypothetical protein